MSIDLKSLGIDQLSVAERIELVDRIWESIVADQGPGHLSAAQREELQRRLDEPARAEDGVPWEQVKAEARKRWRK